MTRFELAQRLGTLLLSVSLASGCQPGADPGSPSARELDGVQVTRALEALREHLGESPRILELRVTDKELSVQLAAPPEATSATTEAATDAPSGSGDAATGDSAKADPTKADPAKADAAAPASTSTSAQTATAPGAEAGPPAADETNASRRSVGQENEAALGQIVEYKYLFSLKEGEPGKVEGPEPLPLRGSGRIDDNVFPLDDVDFTAITAAFPLARSAVDPADGRIQALVVRRFLPFQRAVRARIFVDSPRMSGSFDTNQKGVPLRP